MLKFTRVLIVMLLLSLIVSGTASAQTEARQVWAYYFGWWAASSWEDGRLIDKPAQPYSSMDAGVIGRQIDEAKSAGIDAFIMSWFGPKNGNMTHTVFNMLLDQAAARGFKAAVSVDLVDAGYYSTGSEVVESLRYLINERVNHPAYLRYAGKPVIYFYYQARYSAADWANIRAQVDPNRQTIWVAEGTNTAFLPTFDGLYLFNTAWAGDPAAVASQWFAATRGAGGWFYSPTVLPGWDESRMAGRPNPTSPQDRDNGSFLQASWNGAAASGAGVVLIVSWNEYFENSHIEPSQLHGTQALDTLRPMIAAWEAGGAAVIPAAASSGAPVTGQAESAPSGPLVTVLRPNVYGLNVRGAPALDGPVLGQIGADHVFAVTGEENGWYGIIFEGQQGWVSADFVGLAESTAPGGGGGGGNVASGPLNFTANYILNLRSAPGENSQVLAQIPYLTTMGVQGRSADSQWVQVSFEGQTGWVSVEYGRLSGDIGAAPVTG